MAVIKSLGLGVSIVINGEKVPEYNDPAPDPDLARKHPGTKVVSKYIESEDDLVYSLRCEALPTHRWLPNRQGNVLGFRVYIDGKYQCNRALSFDAWDNKDGASRDMVGVRTSTGPENAGTLSKFRFGSVNPRKWKLLR